MQGMLVNKLFFEGGLSADVLDLSYEVARHD